VKGDIVPLSKVDEERAIAEHGQAPKTDAVPVLPLDASRIAWLDRRRQGVGASEVAVVLGRSPHNSPFSLWWQKRMGWGTPEKFNMRVGTLLEPVIAELFNDRKPDAMLFRPGAALWAHAQYEHMLATPDYLAAFPDRPEICVPVECKSDEGGPGWGPDGTDQVPWHIRCQAAAQAQVFRSPLAYVVRLAGKRLTVHPIAVEGDSDEYMDQVSACSRFMTSLDTGVVPDVDGHEETTRTLEMLYADVVDDDDDPRSRVLVSPNLAQQYAAACRVLRAAAAEQKALANELRLAMQNAAHAYAEIGEQSFHVASRRRYKRNGYEVAPTTVDALYPASEREQTAIAGAVVGEVLDAVQQKWKEAFGG
jgi:predicted phage-related endonuclease